MCVLERRSVAGVGAVPCGPASPRGLTLPSSGAGEVAPVALDRGLGDAVVALDDGSAEGRSSVTKESSRTRFLACGESKSIEGASGGDWLRLSDEDSSAGVISSRIGIEL